VALSCPSVTEGKRGHVCNYNYSCQSAKQRCPSSHQFRGYGDTRPRTSEYREAWGVEKAMWCVRGTRDSHRFWQGDSACRQYIAIRIARFGSREGQTPVIGQFWERLLDESQGGQFRRRLARFARESRLMSPGTALCAFASLREALLVVLGRAEAVPRPRRSQRASSSGRLI